MRSLTISGRTAVIKRFFCWSQSELPQRGGLGRHPPSACLRLRVDVTAGS